MSEHHIPIVAAEKPLTERHTLRDRDERLAREKAAAAPDAPKDTFFAKITPEPTGHWTVRVAERWDDPYTPGLRNNAKDLAARYWVITERPGIPTATDARVAASEMLAKLREAKANLENRESFEVQS
jgi:hypothetical protein